jgi:hypothetical protein
MIEVGNLGAAVLSWTPHPPILFQPHRESENAKDILHTQCTFAPTEMLGDFLLLSTTQSRALF